LPLAALQREISRSPAVFPNNRHGLQLLNSKTVFELDLALPDHSAVLPFGAGVTVASAPTFAEAFAAYAPYVLGLLRRLGVAAADVEDVAQEVFLVIHARLPSFEGRSTLKTWVCGICLRSASNYRRKAYRRREMLVGVTPETVAGSGPDEQLAARQSAALLEQALSTLPEKQMQVFVLFELEEFEMSDVAQAVGCPRFTAYTRLRAARKAVAAAFKEAQRPRRPR
jgi:RNA polymerase sigma-70 factor (ECF subfamily)